jgi:predicted dehydrogenase
MTPSPLQAVPLSRPTLRVGVFGLGREGLALAATLAMRPECELVALGDPSAAALRRARGAGFAAPRYTGLERLIAAAAPQALAIALPPRERAAAVRMAIESGVSTIVEPPMAATLEEAESLVARAQALRVRLAVAHRLPFEPTFAQASHEMLAGVLGHLKLVRSSVYASRVFSTRDARAVMALSPGGVLSGVAFDLLLVLEALFGSPARVRASVGRLYGGHEDEAHAMLTLPDGVEVGLEASWSVPGHARVAAVIEAEGENGVMLVSEDAYEVELEAARGGAQAGHRRRRDAELAPVGRFDLDGETRDPMLAAFLDWSLGGEEPVHTAADSLRAQRTLEAIYSSARRGGTDVRVGRA